MRLRRAGCGVLLFAVLTGLGCAGGSNSAPRGPGSASVLDAGTPTADAGAREAVDAGTAVDGGVAPPDAGAPDAGTPADGGTTADAGTAMDAGTVTYGAAQLLTTEPTLGAFIALDATSVYYSVRDADGTEHLRSILKAGGTPTTLVSWAPGAGVAAVAGLEADDSAVYAALSPCPASAPCQGNRAMLVRVPKQGGAATPVATGVLGPFALSATEAYFTVVVSGRTTEEQVRAVSKSGGASRLVTHGSGEALSDDGADVLWSITGAVRDISTADGSSRDLSTGTLTPGATKAAAQAVYFRSQGPLYAVPRAGGAPVLLWSAPQSQLESVDAWGQVVYWNQTDGTSGGCVGQVRADGTDGRCIDQGPHAYGAVKVDAAAVYFVRDDALVRLPKQQGP